MLIRSSYPDVRIPARSITELVIERARPRGDRTAYVDGVDGAELSFAQLADAIEWAAAGLIAAGMRKGDVCVIHSPNCIEWPVAYHAVLLAGGIVSPTNPMATAGELARQAIDAGASWIFSSPYTLAPAMEAAREAGIAMLVAFAPPEALPEGVISFEGIQADPAATVFPRLDPEDVAIIPYSSGTTGYPKGVMLTHRNLTACAHQLLESVDFGAGGRILAVIPISHISGIMAFLHQAPFIGLSVVTLPRFDVEQFIRTIEARRITLLVAAPPLVLALARHPLVERCDLSSLQTIICAAAPLKENLARACMERVGCEIIQGYGMTECMAVTTGVQGADRPAAAGVPIPNTEFRIVDVSSGMDVGPDEPGEVWVRGPQVMKGYLNRPDATADLITVDGWLKTGDIGHFDEDGYLYVVDRLKELIKYNAHQVAPAELEDILITHPAIVDAAVVGRPDEQAGELPIAYVVADRPVAAGEIIAYVADRVAPYKKIRGVEFVDSIPKSPAGKILRKHLIEQERGLVVA